jgi:hypothetical protein
MGNAVMIGADRLHQDRDRALLGGDAGALAARGAIIAIARPVLGGDHVMADEHDLALHRAVRRGLQVGDGREIGDFTLDPLGRGRSAVAQRRDDQLLREGGDDRRFVMDAFPQRHLIGFDADIGEAQCLELGGGPFAPARFERRGGRARADFGRQPFGNVPGDIILQGGFANRGVAGRSGLDQSGSEDAAKEQGGERARSDFLHG